MPSGDESRPNRGLLALALLLGILVGYAFMSLGNTQPCPTIPAASLSDEGVQDMSVVDAARCPAGGSRKSRRSTGAAGDAGPLSKLRPGSAVVPLLYRRQWMGRMLSQFGLKRGAELGVQRGVFAKAVLSSWTTMKEYHLVDVWAQQTDVVYKDGANRDQSIQDSNYNTAMENTDQWKDRRTVCRNYTLTCVHNYPDEYFDYIFVDARHDRMSVLEDLEYWWPKLKKGGVIAGHDYLTQDEMPSKTSSDFSINYDGSIDMTRRAVKGAADDFFMDKEAEGKGHLLQVTVTMHQPDYPYSSWIVRRPATDRPPIAPMRTVQYRDELGTVAMELKFKRGAELGVRDGDFTRAILPRWHEVQQYVMVDMFKDAADYEEVQYYTAPWKDKVEECRKSTVACAKQFADGHFDFIIVNARHDRKGMLEDLAAWWPKLKKGGVMAGGSYIVAEEVPKNKADEGFNYDGTRTPTRLQVRGAVDDFFMSTAAEEAGRMRQVIASYRDYYTARSWAVRK